MFRITPLLTVQKRVTPVYDSQESIYMNENENGI
jgi:hypothetical protein